LSDDRSNTWAQAGGIQSVKILTQDFVRMVFDVFKTHPHGDRWGVLFSIQIEAGLLKRRAVTGEILLKNEVLYVARYKNYDHDAIVAYVNETCA